MADASQAVEDSLKKDDFLTRSATGTAKKIGGIIERAVVAAADANKEKKRQRQEGWKGEAPKHFAKAAFLALAGIILLFLMNDLPAPWGQFGLYLALFAIGAGIWQVYPKAALVVFFSAAAFSVLNFFGFVNTLVWSTTVLFAFLAILGSFPGTRKLVAKIFWFILIPFGGILIFLISAWLQHTQGGIVGFAFFWQMVTLFMLILYFAWAWQQGGIAALVALLINGVVLFTIISAPEAWIGTGSPFYEGAKGQQEAWENIGEGFTLFGERVVAGFERQRQYVMGDYERGVEESQDKKLGVFLQDVGVSSKIVRSDGIANMFAQLRAETFKTEKELQIDLVCYKRGQEEVRGTMRPPALSVIEFETRNVDCTIPASQLGGTGEHTIIMEARFDFETGAYKRVYFMEQERLRAMIRGDQDPLAMVSEKSPLTHYSPGPVGIGIKTDSMPIPLVERTLEGEPVRFGPSFHVNFENMWRGELESVDEFTITVPAGLEIALVNGKDLTTGEFGGISCSGTEFSEHSCTFSGDFVQWLLPKEVLRDRIVNFGIQTKLTAGGIEQLLGGQSLGFGSIKVDVSYKYKIDALQSVIVREIQTGPAAEVTA